MPEEFGHWNQRYEQAKVSKQELLELVKAKVELAEELSQLLDDGAGGLEFGIAGQQVLQTQQLGFERIIDLHHYSCLKIKNLSGVLQ